jgi:anthranilate phosphoribosyltransferase
MAAEMAARGRSALVFRGEDGLDELTTTGTSHIWQVSGGEVVEFVLDPAKLGLSITKLENLVGGDAHHNAEVSRALFANQTHGNLRAIREVVLLNAASGVVAFELTENASLAAQDIHHRFAEALEKVEQALDSGATEAKLSEWMSVTQA